jgi:hypothetical protein
LLELKARILHVVVVEILKEFYNRNFFIFKFVEPDYSKKQLVSKVLKAVREKKQALHCS